MNVRTTVYLDKKLSKKVNNYENKSKLIKEALNLYFLNRDFFISKKSIIEEDIHELEHQLQKKNKELDFINEQLIKINKKNDERPEGYLDSIDTLKRLPDVTQDDLDFQAKRLSVHPHEFNEWLCADGYYDEIFSP